MKTRTNKTNRKFESLEGRQLMAVNILLNSAGLLKITGNSDNDQAVISIDKRGTTSTTDDLLVVKTNSWTNTTSWFNNRNYKLSAVKSIEFFGGAGGDFFKNLTNIKSIAYGDAGMDALTGGTNDDTLYGGDDGDYIDGRLGNDRIYGDNGDDILAGDKGDDIINAGYGNDYLYGGAGFDGLNGQQGNDWLDGGPGTEFKMLGGSGIDYFYDDTLSFPGGDYKARANEGDKGFIGHPNLGAIDINFADDNVRWQKRWDTMLTTNFPVIPTYVPAPTPTPTPTPIPTPTPTPTPVPVPVPVPVPTPTPTPVDYNAKVLSYAQSVIGQRILRGECTDLITEALRLAGAKGGSNFEQPGFYVWGQAVSLSSAKGGDIIQFAPGTTFKTTFPDGSWTTSTMGSTIPGQISGHTAIIESVNGNVVTLLDQNAPRGGPVRRSTLDLSSITVGSYQIFRPIPA